MHYCKTDLESEAQRILRDEQRSHAKGCTAGRTPLWGIRITDHGVQLVVNIAHRHPDDPMDSWYNVEQTMAL